MIGLHQAEFWDNLSFGVGCALTDTYNALKKSYFGSFSLYSVDFS